MAGNKILPAIQSSTVIAQVSGPKKGDRNMEGVISSCSGSHRMSYIITKPTVTFPQTETYYEQSHIQDVLKVTNRAENEIQHCASGTKENSPHHHHSRIIIRRGTASQKPGDCYEDCD
ncbi:hypothetical protein CDAR_541371 [Caerostris darwini]|uniref:Uncharacterized protein n=1 Tax=Caerostris darwini TaxID=1538125 RepID=A0AAV4VWW0_9ARAC|nr:hypothetical protein CDAR_541371 [Caerostris darwini]